MEVIKVKNLYKNTLSYNKLLEQFGLQDKVKKLVSELSGSERQRLFIILALTQGIKLLKSTSLNLSVDNEILPILVISILAVICSGVSIKFFRWE